MHNLEKGGRGWIITDVHLGLTGHGRAGDRASGYLRALFMAANITQLGPDPVKFLGDLGDRGSKKVRGQSALVHNTLEYANCLNTLNQNIYYCPVDGNHETEPGFRAEIIKSRTGRAVPRESYSVDFGAISLNFLQAEVLATNKRGALRFNPHEIKAYKDIKEEHVARDNRLSLDMSHIPFGDVRQNIIDVKLHEHKGRDDYEDYKGRLQSSQNLVYANHTEMDQIKMETSMPLLELFGHIHTPFLAQNFMEEEKMVALPAFCGNLPETGEEPSAAFCELRVEGDTLSLEFKRIVRGDSGAFTVLVDHEQEGKVLRQDTYSIVPNDLVPEAMNKALAKISLKDARRDAVEMERVFG